MKFIRILIALACLVAAGMVGLFLIARYLLKPAAERLLK